MKLTLDQVKHVAKLANLPLTSEEEETYAEQLSKILEYIKQLDKIDTQGVEPTFNVTMNKNVTREDRVGKMLPQEKALSNASAKKNGLFVAKGVFEET